ncbi:MAG: hypothetical protein A3G33_07645 [Omnitrophica bacterium RIFCSPLOWO2_12_FULL_44_17]|uniref:Uncharacterized protein n=1 Tax=Candidatus Danuiimicrobium aquiferis TaxID=1801832 RepID=A0A1G1KYW3_9BACT|nr:MAG: hypothetical protein A3B72_07945 [Omnitrophica bacterium RIFCSPHIGHO2_02_FULL_45_28]OGW91458.1 MAG: hypothetical protein A3E74_00740 [Omnitrophica bacterium RIFCSPHIGHO2_12_FULL_44_12]OGW98090.1 MAG: hypothetical protein A3G33_07645 [Omnitrophica bacterium RIFCSPLOWO2_12_FULL_44_17]OGX03468.1 MAG: hypothetical protein A3J12_02580 [Omnitrophica bacterium RIFCSPLOWO2_02_FULL_44_11]
MRFISIFFIFFVFLSQTVFAEGPMVQNSQNQVAELSQTVKSLQETVKQLQLTVQSQNEVLQQQNIRIAGLEQSKTSPQQTGAVVPVSASTTRGISQGFNPDIGMVGSVVGKLTESKEDQEGNNSIALKELELNVGHVVDPFSRADAVISFNDAIGDQNANIEEAYYTRWGLPLGFTGQIGKFRSKIGKQNLLHSHQLDTVDYPLVIRDFFGEEGLASSGARLSNMIPNPWDQAIEITGEILRGNNGTSFSGISRRPIFNSHVKTYFDLPSDANAEVGWTTLFGDENPDTIYVDDSGNTVVIHHLEGQTRYGVKVYGADLTIHMPLPEGKKLKWQNELYFQNRTNRVHPNDKPWGFYTLLDYRFSEKFSTGVRFDYVQPLDVFGNPRETTSISPYLTFWQSEYADFRLQYSHTGPENSTGKVNNELFLKTNFLIGAHKHPVE